MPIPSNTAAVGQPIKLTQWNPVYDQARAINGVDHLTLLDELLPNGELWELDTPYPVSNLGRRPRMGHSIVHMPPWVYDEGRAKYANPLARWGVGGVTESAFNDFRSTADPTGQGRGVLGFFEATENLVFDPEDGTSDLYEAPARLASITLLEETFRNSQWTRLVADGTSGGHALLQYITGGGFAATPRLSAGQKIVSIVLRKPATNGQDAVTFQLVDNDAAATRFAVDVTFSTKVVSAGVGTLIRREWYGDDIVVIVGLSTTVTAANHNYINIRIGTGTETTALDFTRAMVLDTDLEAPYTPTTRPENRLTYRFSAANQGTIECWVRPFFGFDFAGTNRLIFDTRSTLGEDNSVVLFYNTSTAKFTFIPRRLTANLIQINSTAAFVSNATLQKWIHLRGVWDAPNNTADFYQDGVVQTDKTTTGTLVGADFPSRKLLGIGQSMLTVLNDDRGGMAITDMRYQSVVDASTAHFTAGRPYYSRDRLLGEDSSYRRDRWGNEYAGRRA